jgi:hypothetical protein
VIEELKHTLGSPGWKSVIQPQLEEQQKAALNNLTQHPEDRPQKVTDEFIRGYFQGLSFALNRWNHIIEQAEADATRAKATAAEAERPALGSPYAETVEAEEEKAVS